jgi:hypothetical protein
MRTAFRLSIASVLIATSAGFPCWLGHQGQLKLMAGREALQRQADQASRLLHENSRLSNALAQAQAASPPLTEERLHEMLRLRNEVRLLREQTSQVTRLEEENEQLKARLAGGIAFPTNLSAAEAGAALREEMQVDLVRPRFIEVAAPLGIAAEDAIRLADRFAQEQPRITQKLDAMEKTLTGSPQERQKAIESAREGELNRLATETIGDRGPAVIKKYLDFKEIVDR